MPSLKLHFETKMNPRIPVLIYPVLLQKKKKPVFCGMPSLDRLLEKRITDEAFSGEENETFVAFPDIPRLAHTVVFAGFGTEKKLTGATVLNAIASATKTAKQFKKSHIGIIVTKQLLPHMQEIAEAIALGNYNPAKYKTGKDKIELGKQEIKEVTFVLAHDDRKARGAAKKAFIITDAVNQVRDFVNGPPNVVTGAYLEDYARTMAKKYGYKITALHKKELEKLNMGALLSVNKGSDEEARMLVLEYTPKGSKKDEKPVVIVGKGILFDSGGYNLKPSNYIETMHQDMAGAAVTICMFNLLAELKIPHRVIGLAPLTTNLIGAEASKPSDIIMSAAGKTIEITNTDAEGRLILADALYYAQQFKPRHLIDLATLTGACMVALGDRYAGLFANNEELEKKLRVAGDAVDELLWPLPIHKDWPKRMKSDIADLRNSEVGRYAGASKGAAFLKEFVGDAPWAHLDIAGVAFTENPKPYEAKMATGFGIRLLTRFLEQLNAE